MSPTLLAVFVLASALFVSYFVFASAQAQTTEPSDEAVKASGITFPVAELGNCNSKEECRSYCNDASHMDACIGFAKSHGLMNKEEADRAEKFKGAMQSGGTPGGCTNPRDCQAFCSDVKNMETCVQFAEKHGVKDKNIEQAKKILNHIKSGGQTPGACTSEASCKQYCSDFSHAEECFEFAKKAGIVQARGSAGEKRGEPGFNEDVPDEEQFQKFIALAKSGNTPGGCKSKETCESYCQGGNHVEECVAFGEQIGFVSAEEAAMIRKSGGKGPGGCSSRQACEAFCNDPAHQEECFKFAEEHGFVKHEEVQRTKEGFVRLRAGLEQAPPEVAECLKSTVGQNVLDDIQSGNVTPGPAIGENVRGCFEKFGHKGNSNQLFKDAPPEVLSCLREKLGDGFAKVQSGESMPTPEMADTFRVCFQQVQFEKGGFENFGGPQGEGGEQGGGGFPPAPGQGGQGGGFGSQGGERGGRGFGGGHPSAGQFLKNAPPGISTCLKEKLGDKLEAIQSGGEQPGPEFGQTLKSCFEGFNPRDEYKGFHPRSDEQGGFRDQGRQGGFGEQGGQGFQGRFRGEGGEIPAPGVTCPNRESCLEYCKVKNIPESECEKLIGHGFGDEGGDQGKHEEGFRGGFVPGGEGQQQGGEQPLFNKRPYPQSVPSFSTSSSYPQPSVGTDQYQNKYPSSGQYPPSPSDQKYPSQYQQPQYPQPYQQSPSGSATQPPPSGTTQSSTYQGGAYQQQPAPSGNGTYSSDPAAGCAKSGGTWDAAKNYCQMPGSTSPSGSTQQPTTSGTTQPSTSDTHACPSGQYWNGSTCVSSTYQSYPSGGSYTPPPSGSTTQPPPSDSGSGSYSPPPSGSGSYTPPPSGTTQPPPPPPGGNLLQIFKSLLFFAR